MKRAVYLWIIPVALSVAVPVRAETPAAPAPSAAPKAVAGPIDLPATISLDLKEAKAPEVERALRKALRIDVRLDGFLLRPLTLKLDEAPRDEALRRIADAIGGSWRRLFSWTPGGEGSIVATKATTTVKLRLTSAPCSSAAAMLASSAGAWAEGHTKLTGKITFDGTEMPIADALAKVAKASGASCRELMSLRTKAFEERERALANRKSSEITASGKRPKRDKFSVLAKYGAKAPVREKVDPEEIEARAQLGAFAGIFATTDRGERLQRVRKLRASMETQNRRQENYRPEHRTLAATFEVRHLREMLADHELLTDEQKKDVKVLMDYVKKRVVKLESVLSTDTPRVLLTPKGGEESGKE